MESLTIDFFPRFYVSKIARKFMKFSGKREAIDLYHFLLFGNDEL